MFYITDINGALVPFEVLAAASSSSAPVGTAVPVKELAVEEPSLISSAAVTVAEATDDSAVYDGHAIPRSGDVVLGNASSVAWAGAVRSYRIQASDRVAEALPVESSDAIESVEAASMIGSGLGESAQRVNPVRREGYHAAPDRERKRAVTARDLMSAPVFTLNEELPLEEAWRVFREHKFRHIPVVSAVGALVGILSDRDFIGEQLGSGRTVRDRMVTNILTARPETEIQMVAEVMISHHIGCLPIVDERGSLVGVLTRSDILRAIVNHAPIELWT